MSDINFHGRKYIALIHCPFFSKEIVLFSSLALLRIHVGLFVVIFRNLIIYLRIFHILGLTLMDKPASSGADQRNNCRFIYFTFFGHQDDDVIFFPDCVYDRFYGFPCFFTCHELVKKPIATTSFPHCFTFLMNPLLGLDRQIDRTLVNFNLWLKKDLFNDLVERKLSFSVFSWGSC